MNRKDFCIIILILLFGTFLRFYNLGGESFWADEGATGMAIKKHSAMQIFENVREKGQFLPEYYSSDDDLPLYYLLLKLWSYVFGISDYSLRAFSAFFGSLALIAVYCLSKMLFDKNTAVLATSLSSVNLTLIWYAQDARQYSYLFFLSIISVIFLLKSLHEKKTVYAVLFAITNIFILYTHFPWVMFMTFEGVYMLYFLHSEYRQKKKMSLKPNIKIIAAFLLLVILYSAIIWRALSSHTNTLKNFGKPGMEQLAKFGIQLSTWLYPTESMAGKLNSYIFDFSFSEWMLLISTLLFALILGIFFIYGIYLHLKGSRKRESLIFLLFMFFIPLAFALILSYAHPIVTVFQIKQLIYIIPPFLIIASAGCLKLKYSKAAIIILAMLIILPLAAHYMNIDREQFREAANFLPRDEAIFIHKENTRAVFRYYYGEKQNAIGVANLDELKNAAKGKDRFWFLFTFLKYSSHEQEIKKFLSQNYKITETKHLFGIDLVHYEKK
jgi:uncharacterized membrane protein